MPYGLGNIYQDQRRRQRLAPSADGDSNLPAHEPDVTDPRDAYRMQEEKPSFIEHPYRSDILAGLAGPQAQRGLAEARRNYQRRQEDAQKFQYEQDLAERKYRNQLAVSTLDPTAAADEFTADVVRRHREEKEQKEAEAQQQHEEEFERMHPEKPPAPPINVAPGHELLDSETHQRIYKAPYAPQRTASQENQERDDEERGMERIGKLRDESYARNAAMEAIRSQVKKAPAEGQKPLRWDDEAPDAEGMTYRQKYTLLKKQNAAAVSEINRLWGKMRGGKAEAAPPAPRASAAAPSNIPGPQIPRSDAPDQDVMQFLSADPDLAAALRDASPEERAAWLAKWRAAQRKAETGE